VCPPQVRGAGTKAQAWLQLIGADGASGKVCFEGSDDGFPRGSLLQLRMLAPRSMGAIKRVLVERAKRSASDLGDGWFLEQVEVHGPRGEHTVFPCHSWLGSSDCGNIVCEWRRLLSPPPPLPCRAPQPQWQPGLLHPTQPAHPTRPAPSARPPTSRLCQAPWSAT
jgi:hypothetical protein